MMRTVLAFVTLGMSVLLAGCGIGLGLAPRSSYETLHPKPYVTLWEKPGMTQDSRLQDWVACGGTQPGDFGYASADRLPGESQTASEDRQSFRHQRCMIRRGYRYTGNCSSAYMKARPLCGAP